MRRRNPKNEMCPGSDRNGSRREQQLSPRSGKLFSGRFPVRIPRYLHRQLTLVAREQGVSLNQFVCTAAVMAAGLNGGVPEQSHDSGWNRVSEEQYARIWNRRFA
jgi:hypothetical protein